MRLNTILFCLCTAGITLTGNAGENVPVGDFPADSVAFADVAVAPKKANIFQRVTNIPVVRKLINYFDDANKPKERKKFDFSVIGGPHYSTDTKFGIGLVAAGVYSVDTAATAPQSDVAIYLDATTSLFFKLGVRGTHIGHNDATRLHYDLNFSSVKTNFWGIGYDMEINNANKCSYRYLNGQAEVSYVWRLAPAFYVGPMGNFDYIRGYHFGRPELWDGQAAATVNGSVGVTVQYDTRDYLTNAYKGAYVRFDLRYSPRFMANRYSFGVGKLTAAYYHQAWRGAVLAAQFRSCITYGDTPWGLMPTLGGSDNMRGYFEGRFRDKSEMDVCLELRQHVWRRNGIVAWVGAGTVFPKFSAMRWNKILPNYGIGYRWEFKKRVNVRLDLGFGRNQTGFIFSINEAF